MKNGERTSGAQSGDFGNAATPMPLETKRYTPITPSSQSSEIATAWIATDPESE